MPFTLSPQLSPDVLPTAGERVGGYAGGDGESGIGSLMLPVAVDGEERSRGGTAGGAAVATGGGGGRVSGGGGGGSTLSGSGSRAACGELILSAAGASGSGALAGGEGDGGGGGSAAVRLPVSMTGSTPSCSQPLSASSSSALATSTNASSAASPSLLAIAATGTGTGTGTGAPGSAGHSPRAAPSAAPEAVEARVSAVASVHVANSRLLLRQHLYDPTYIGFLVDLVRLAFASPSAAELVASAAAEEASITPRALLHLSPPPAELGDAWPLPPPCASWLRVELLRVACRFLFAHLLRLSASLLEPHAAGWAAAIEAGCRQSLPAALWTLHALVERRDTAGADAEGGEDVVEATAEAATGTTAATGQMGPVGPTQMATQLPPTAARDGSGGGCWLLGALFDCQSSAARSAMVGLITRIVTSVAAAEAAAEGDTRLAGCARRAVGRRSRQPRQPWASGCCPTATRRAS